MARKKKVIDDNDPLLSTQIGKYFLNTQRGMNKRKAAEMAGYQSAATNASSSGIESRKSFQILKRRYADVLQEEISIRDIAREHLKNIVQDEDKGAKNTAIKMAMDKIEPEINVTIGDDDKMIVVLKG